MELFAVRAAELALRFDLAVALEAPALHDGALLRSRRTREPVCPLCAQRRSVQTRCHPHFGPVPRFRLKYGVPTALNRLPTAKLSPLHPSAGSTCAVPF